MSELQQYYDDFCRAYWANQDPNECRCGGRGWALSEVDTWHQCPIHYNGQRHPEDDSTPEELWATSGQASDAFVEAEKRMVERMGLGPNPTLKEMYQMDPRESFPEEGNEAPF